MENLYSFYLDSKDEAEKGGARVFGWEFTGFPCEKCIEVISGLGTRPVGARGECLICKESMKSVQFGPEEAGLVSGIAEGKMQNGEYGVAHFLFDTRRTANGADSWFKEKSLSIEPEVEATTFGSAVEIHDPKRFDPLSFKIVTLDKGVKVVIGKFRKTEANAASVKKAAVSAEASVKMAERMGYRW
jgi:hypothetical protein